MKASRLFCIILGLSVCLLAAAKSPIKTQCKTADSCRIVETKTGKILIKNLPSETTTKAVGKNIFEIHTSCGSPCSASFYYNAENGQLSGSFPDVVALSSSGKKVLYATDGQIFCADMFLANQPAHRIKTKRPLASTAATVSAIVSAKFLSPSRIKLTYLSGKKYAEITETINLTSKNK
ncbi:MAG: hypothetical protein HY080_13020 [Gammaproteobacteria bacterium]|nr:hypothetical protein [Gammaproteobacteria bacterium]